MCSLTNFSSMTDPEQRAELGRLGLTYYDEKLKAILEPERNNEFVAIHVDSGDYEVAKTSGKATRAILERHPIDGRLVIRKIGPEPEYGLAARILAGEMHEAYQKSLKEGGTTGQTAQNPAGSTEGTRTMAESATTTDNSEEHLSPLTRLALAIYRERLQAVLEPEQNGRGVAIHPESGDYAVAPTPTQAGHILRKRHPEGKFVTMSIGPEPDYALAARLLAGQQGRPGKF